jgi:hypothetical protein
MPPPPKKPEISLADALKASLKVPPPKKDQSLPPWVDIETERKKRRPKAAPKPADPKPRLHVKINLTGSVEFNLEGDQAAELKGYLQAIGLEDVLDFLDPWASGAVLTHEVDITETPTAKHWIVDEAADVIESIIPFDPWMLK